MRKVIFILTLFLTFLVLPKNSGAMGSCSINSLPPPQGDGRHFDITCLNLDSNPDVIHSVSVGLDSAHQYAGIANLSVNSANIWSATGVPIPADGPAGTYTVVVGDTPPPGYFNAGTVSIGAPPIGAGGSFNISDAFTPANTFTSFGALATVAVKFLISIVGILAFIFIIISGIKIVTSSGDSKKLSSATSTLLYAIIGLAVAIMALVIINIVQKFIGSSVPIT